MERILNLKKRRYLKNTLKIALIYSKLYLTISDLDSLEIGLSKKYLEFENIEGYLHRLSQIVSIVEELNLNRRIWSKT